MNKQELRKRFTQYFADRGHEKVASSSLVPQDDPTLLFNNAGMNQFKNVFTGLEKRPYNKATSIQKCVRAGGKHNDLDNVGFTARHHTFFEMLGNFSFGDYFKKEAIAYAWDFLTNELKLPKDKLYVTVFETDDEAYELWKTQEGVPEDRIYRFGEDDNFWRMGKTGPCGPCSEIFYDLGPSVGGDPKQNVMGGEGDRYIEVWNLVFMQYNEDEQGNLNPLPKPSVDTGAGIERLTAILQKEISNYHTDDFLDLIRTAENIGKVRYEKISNDKKQDKINVALRVLADHARTTAFLIADGVLPSNEGRGYVLRRIMRRAIRYGRQLNTDKSFLPDVVETVIQKMGDYYPELKHSKSQILSNTKEEEERFLKTLDLGTDILNTELKKVKNKTLSAEIAFRLYDTYGFPFDLTQLMAAEKNISVSEDQFHEHMEKAKEKARASWKGDSVPNNKAHMIASAQKIASEFGPTKFEGYDFNLKTKSKVIFLSSGEAEVDSLKEGESGLIAFEKTCFYAEGGGQAGDLGLLTDGDNQAEVVDCVKQGDIFLLSIKVTDGVLTKNEVISQQVHETERRKTTQHHSATHLLHAALRNVLGEHITQAGSSVDHTRLRFDYTHKGPMSPEEISKVEKLVNEQIDKALPVTKNLMSHKEALAAGALALFGEKYGDEVRVLGMGDFSTELCGGTHVSNTAEIRAFKIMAETGVSSGVRRIEALAGQVAIDKLNNTIEEQNNNHHQLIKKYEQKLKDLEKKFQTAQSQKIDVDQLIADGISFDQGKLVLADIPMDDRKFLSQISDQLLQKVQSGIIVVIGKGEESNPIIVSVTKNLNPGHHAGNILKSLAAELGGKGGGRPDFAQGAAPKRDMELAMKILQENL